MNRNLRSTEDQVMKIIEDKMTNFEAKKTTWRRLSTVFSRIDENGGVWIQQNDYLTKRTFSNRKDGNTSTKRRIEAAAS